MKIFYKQIIGLLLIILAYCKYVQSDPTVSEQICECWQWPTCTSNCTGKLTDVVAQNRNHLKSLKTPFVISFPYQIKKQNRNYDTSTKRREYTYFQSTKFYLRHLQHFQVKLQHSKIFNAINNYATNSLRKRGDSLLEVESNKINQCHYQGIVKGNTKAIPNSYVALSTCDGLKGLIYFNNVTYGIRPLNCDNCPHNPHVIYPEVESIFERDTQVRSFWRTYLMGKSFHPPTEPSHTFPVNVGFIIDHRLFTNFLSSTERSVQYAARILNLVTKSFHKLERENKQLELRLTNVEIWNMNDRIRISSSIKTTLNSLASYLLSTRAYAASSQPTISSNKSQFYSRYKRAAIGGSKMPDTVFLLTRQFFTDVVEYLTVPDSICTPRAVSVIQVMDPEAEYNISRLAAMALAEQFSINSFPCPPFYTPCNSSDVLSDGDIKRLMMALLSGKSNCLLQEQRPPLKNTCGNGRVDFGEECDDPNSPCCDKITCLAPSWAMCVEGDCCRNCSLLSRGQICKPAKDECDLPGFCSGDSGKCPNIFLEDGQFCRQKSAMCYRGRCPALDLQCETLYGSTARGSPPECFKTYNDGFKDSCGNGVKCTEEHVMCGFINCKGGSKVPLIGGKVYLKQIISSENKSTECKVVKGIKEGYVQDGTQCAPNKFCFGQRCVSQVSEIKSKCLKPGTQNITCMNGGLCTSQGKCFCQLGWTGDHCEELNNSTEVDLIRNLTWIYINQSRLNATRISGPTDKAGTGLVGPLATIYLIAILVGVIAVVFCILIVVIACYRRFHNGSHSRSKQGKGTPLNFIDNTEFTMSSGGRKNKKRHSNKHTFMNGRSTEEEEITDDTMERMIKFGSMPSYREDKINKMINECNLGSDQGSLGSHGNHSTSLPNNYQQMPTSFITTQSTSIYQDKLVTALNGNKPCGPAIARASPATGNPYDLMDNSATQLSSILMENSWRQPEKGILKNKSDSAQMNPGAAAPEKRRASSSSAPQRDSNLNHATSHSSLSSYDSSVISVKPDSGPAPLILCNAGNQTDHLSVSARTDGNDCGDDETNCDQSGGETDFECDQPDCPDCVYESQQKQIAANQNENQKCQNLTNFNSECLPLQGQVVPNQDSINGIYEVNSEDGVGTGQNSETEVDAHFMSSGNGSQSSSQNNPYTQKPVPYNGSSEGIGAHEVTLMLQNRRPLKSLNRESPPSLPQIPSKHFLPNERGLIGNPMRQTMGHPSQMPPFSHHPAGSHLDEEVTSAFKHGEAMDFGPDDRLSEVRSNEGTWEGSDTSSLPDTNALDLLQIAHLQSRVPTSNGVNMPNSYLPYPGFPPYTSNTHYNMNVPSHTRSGASSLSSQSSNPLQSRYVNSYMPLIDQPHANTNNAFTPSSPRVPPPSGFNTGSCGPHPLNASSYLPTGLPPALPPLGGPPLRAPPQLFSPQELGLEDPDSEEPSLRRKSYSKATDSYENLLNSQC